MIIGHNLISFERLYMFIIPKLNTMIYLRHISYILHFSLHDSYSVCASPLPLFSYVPPLFFHCLVNAPVSLPSSSVLPISYASPFSPLTTSRLFLLPSLPHPHSLPSTPPPFLPHIYRMVGSDFAAAAALITMGAVLGRASPFQLIVITFFELMLYSANEAINLHVYKAADVGGSMLIHTFGAYFGLAVSFVMYKKRTKDHPKNSTNYHSDLFAMIGELQRKE